MLGRVVAGRFRCSYALVSLTQTAPARPRGCLCACVHVRVPVCTPVCARVCVPLGGGVPLCVRGVYAVWRGVVCGGGGGWRGVAVCGGAGAYLFSFWGAAGAYLFFLWCGASLFSFCAVLCIPLFPVRGGVCCACTSFFVLWCVLYSYLYSYLFRLFPPLSASLTPLLSISMTIKNGI